MRLLKKYREENKEDMLLYWKEYRLKNKDRINELRRRSNKDKEYYAKNREKRLARKREKYWLNKRNAETRINEEK